MRVLHSLKARVVTGVAGIGSLAAAASVALYGAYDGTRAVAEPVFGAGSTVQTGQWRLVPHAAWLASGKVYDVWVKPGHSALVVEAELTNRTAESSHDYLDLLQWRAPPGVTPAQPAVVSVRDPQQGPALHPGLPERVAFVWPLPAGVAPPPQAVFAVESKTYKPVDNLYGTPGWFNPVLIGRVELPVRADAPQDPR
ncbi:hypothetical protein AZ20_1560 [Bordetella bronchiseptica E014]|uniref:hypothetical protein n=1 Tax=Bordetella bronchiseptica TaxID=518 RepID=UPI000459C1E3|nr:hypothetical protein [Bordetella bronchiseptica]AUL14828.1 hypothetical protein BTL45_07990 [Bordetella bronchiseptica]AWP57924.1 hypothetical protein B7P02_07940 [Bordetella bronchiseptica]KAK74570.1 hypothetical protein L507_1625 [Bordetella bronchiseptica CA90 BB02]KCV54367.1 hypothetical protein L492_1648 [Bordetella bronchiseptica 7E71]KDC16267.1 hypothetical protein AZ20_1560 [Bordetella bronchiseptica E014]